MLKMPPILWGRCLFCYLPWICEAQEHPFKSFTPILVCPCMHFAKHFAIGLGKQPLLLHTWNCNSSSNRQKTAPLNMQSCTCSSLDPSLYFCLYTCPTLNPWDGGGDDGVCNGSCMRWAGYSIQLHLLFLLCFSGRNYFQEENKNQAQIETAQVLGPHDRQKLLNPSPGAPATWGWRLSSPPSPQDKIKFNLLIKMFWSDWP